MKVKPSCPRRNSGIGDGVFASKGQTAVEKDFMGHCLCREQGATAVIVAVVISTLVVFLALVVDVGQFYLLRSRLQAAADSAALAAAQDLAEKKGSTVAESTARSYADRNLEVDHQTAVTFPDAGNVKVELESEQRTFFAVIFGRLSVEIRARAQAAHKPVSSVRGTVPIIVPYQSIAGHVGSENVAVFEIGADNSNAGQKGFFWLVNFSGQGVGTPVFADWIINGYQEPVAVGMVGAGEGMKAALVAALTERRSRDPSVIVPLYDFTEASGGNKNYHVVGFAEFVIIDFNFQGQPKSISGYFTTGTVVEGEAEQTPPVNFGIDVVRLED